MHLWERLYSYYLVSNITMMSINLPHRIAEYIIGFCYHLITSTLIYQSSWHCPKTLRRTKNALFTSVTYIMKVWHHHYSWISQGKNPKPHLTIRRKKTKFTDTMIHVNLSIYQHLSPFPTMAKDKKHNDVLSKCPYFLHVIFCYNDSDVKSMSWLLGRMSQLLGMPIFVGILIRWFA